MKVRITIIILFLLTATIGFSQTKEEKKETAKTEKKKAKQEKKQEPPAKGKVYFAPLPLLMSNPTFGFMYGVAASTSAYLGDPKTTRLSTSLGSVS